MVSLFFALSTLLGAQQAFAAAAQVLQLGNPSLSIEQGKTVTMAMRFVGSPQPANYTVFVHLVSANGTQYPGGDHAPSVPTSTWNGPISYNTSRLIPTSMPVGNYTIRVGLYSGANRYAMIPGPGVTVDGETRYTVGTLNVRAPGTPAPAPSPAPVPAKTTVNMLGTPNLSVAPGGTVTMAMRWNAVPMPANYTVFVHLVSANGTQYSGGDHAPSVPTSTWNGPISYNWTRAIPASMPTGTYTIRVGLYSGANRYAVNMGPGVTVDGETRYTVGTLTIGNGAPVPAPAPTPTPTPTPPPAPAPVPGKTTVNMLGTPNLSVAAGGTVTMAMRWNAVPMPANYTVFVHLVSANGTQYPGGDHDPSVPTSTWNGPISYNWTRAIPADMPVGTYSIRVGLYSGANRYAVNAGSGVTVDGETRYTVGTLKVSAGSAPAPAPAPGPAPAPPPSSGSGPAGVDGSLYNLTFNDEFNSFNTAVWNEAVWYETSDATKNFTTENGLLKIWPQRNAAGQFKNRTIDTDGKYYQTYGFFEMEARLPYGKGTWPAFWLFNHIGDRRPEIDIMEAYSGGGPSSGWSDANLHPTAFGATIWITLGQHGGGKVLQTPDLSAAFHKYGLKWEPNRLTFYFDGVAFYSANVSFNDPMYLMLDLWFGSASGTPDNSTPQGKGNSYEVNYVRAWKLK
jgi:hypothetical protein